MAETKRSHQKKIKIVTKVDESKCANIETLLGCKFEKNGSNEWHVRTPSKQHICACDNHSRPQQCTTCKRFHQRCLFVDVDWDMGNLTTAPLWTCMMCQYGKHCRESPNSSVPIIIKVPYMWIYSFIHSYFLCAMYSMYNMSSSAVTDLRVHNNLLL